MSEMNYEDQASRYETLYELRKLSRWIQKNYVRECRYLSRNTDFLHFVWDLFLVRLNDAFHLRK